MDARGAKRLLERIEGIADTAEHVGSKYVETMQHEPSLSPATQERLTLLYREHALRVMQLYSSLGLSICDAIERELDDENSRGQVDLMRANFRTFNDRARLGLEREIGAKAKLA
jgi:hypothetical protein